MELGVVTFLLDGLRLLAGEVHMIPGIHGHIDNLRLELESIYMILKEAYTRQQSNTSVSPWIRAVGQLAFEIEDVIDKYKLYAARQSSKPLRNLISFHSIGKQIEDIQKRINDIRQIRERYREIISSQAQASSTTTSIETRQFPKVACLFLDDPQIVGFVEPANQLVSWIGEPISMTAVISVVGMGGLSKTTLVRKVYRLLKGNFECHAWVAVGQSYRKTEILRSLLSQLCQSINWGTPEVEQQMIRPNARAVQLMGMVKDYLQHKRNLVVFDDIWSLDVREYFKYLFPNDECSSRIIVTTRRNDVANSCIGSCGHVYNLQPLPLKEAQELLCKKAFSSTLGECSSNLKVLSEKIVKRCEGLPLAVVAIGKLVETEGRKNNLYLENLHDTLASELARNEQLSCITRILSLSFNNLMSYSFHHTYCLLYISIFPKGYAVSCRRLIRLWIAEGFVQESSGRRLEDVAEAYLNDLIKRNLVYVMETEIDERPRTCRLHYLVNDILVSKAENENFSKILKESDTSLEKVRRLSVHNDCSRISFMGDSSPCVRAFFRFPMDESSSSFFNHKVISNFRLLKVLDLENAPLKTFPKGVDNLLLLRYLSSRNTKIKDLPKSQTYITELSSEILQLHRLRHLLIYRYDFLNYAAFGCVRGFSVHGRIGGLTTLQKLAFVKASMETRIIDDLQNLTQLRKLGIVEVRRESGEYLCLSIEKMQSLHTLSITSESMEEYLDLNTLSHPPRHLQRLYLKGQLERMPRWISELQNLVRIRLKWSKLSDDPTEALQDLPTLLDLQLLDAYTGSELLFSEGKFKKLKILEFNQLRNLRKVMMDNGTLPQLQKLIIRSCPLLTAVPIGIDNLTQLEELYLHDMTETFINGIQKNGGKYRRMVNHIPIIHSYSLGSFTNLS
uniref:Disease resistance protein RPM1-like n=1 Tax=Nelumbo nucifera TaxID=4432 RepID=A0A822Z069_NELNU|nr:TPA_asm: hypothetical protein HUJ06_014077 [Nelumbo nucifera]